MTARYEEEIGAAQIPPLGRDLTDGEVAALWLLFEGIDSAWSLGGIAPTLKTQWVDMLHARASSGAELSGEYVNAAAVIAELKESAALDWKDLVFFKTLIAKPEEAKTRLQHAKYHVVNDFIRCFILLGGFKFFGGRNYRGYMGGSRFGDTPPVRIGSRK
jgi:hypothetical protein